MIWIILAIIVIIVLWLIISYNGLVRSRMHTQEAWSQMCSSNVVMILFRT